MYSEERRVGFSEIAPDYGVRLTKILDYFQDVTIRQSEDLNAGVGVRDLRGKGTCWVLNSWQVVIERYPELDEKIYVCTAPVDFKGFLGTRMFLIKNEQGEELVKANSIWAMVDTEKMSLTRVPNEVVEAYELGEKLDMEYASRKIKTPELVSPGEPICAKYHNIDVNNHINNAQYVGIAEDLIPEGRRCKQVRVEYRTSAQIGDTIIPFVDVNEDKTVYTVTLADTEHKPYVLVEFTM